nr:TAT-variant-translocated molybdopterin oxidoreductase [uncultured Holophaga sp.]
MDMNTDDRKPRAWRSLEEWEGLPAASDEFPPGGLDGPGGGFSRRSFLKLMGASAALASAIACDRKGSPLVPYTSRPRDVVPGVANLYASTFPLMGRAHPVLVTTREGRPIHVSGHDTAGPAPLWATADILGLYDPDRLKSPRLEGRSLPWPEAEKRLAEGLRGGGRVLLITGASASPTRRGLLEAFARALPGTDHLVWEPADAVEPRLHLDQARVVLSLGADFLGGTAPRTIRAFADRRLEGDCRLWVAEGPMTLTGANADQRIPIRPSRLAGFALALAQGLEHPVAPPEGVEPGLWHALLGDLRKAGGRSLVLCGEGMPSEAREAAHLLNARLGALGRTIEYVEGRVGADPVRVLGDLDAGVYGAVVVWQADPVFTSPAGARWREALRKAPFRAWIGLREDETARACSLQLPEHHWLEAWGDHEVAPGLLSLQQPTSEPLFDTRQGEDLLLGVLRSMGQPVQDSYHEHLRDRWRREVHPGLTAVPFEDFFSGVLHEGVLKVPALPGKAPEPPVGVRATAPVSGFELVLAPDPRILDGRFANNAWLQELPEPVTKTTWGNPLALSLRDAQALGLREGDLVRLESGQGSLEVPVHLQPGQAEGVLSLALGYGRSLGRVAKGVGVNAHPLLPSEGGRLCSGVRLTPTGRHREVPRTQTHHRLGGRDILRIQHPGEHAPVREAGELTTLYPDMLFPEHRWGMVIDLARCVGCSTCVLACQSENNIPVVGPEEVAKGREMHWIRIDRYYEGDPANPVTGHQPMLCQQCDHAPCENVCPAGATNHSPDGINQMIYNRCVGTRYCGNNCPYKVRRFNYLEYVYGRTDTELLARNPEVTVRPRGVMEKCTFCIQRIQDARVRAKLEKRPLQDGDIVPACAAACPARAIVFGDLKDPRSRVSRLLHEGRAYKVLEELGTRPAITYLAALRNPAGGGKA